jgi:DNA-binding MarR family transcriptional regulator
MNARQFFYDFGKALYHIDAVYDDFAKTENVAPTLLWILYALGDGNAHTQKEICEDWELPKSTVNTVVRELKEQGYAELVPIKGKRRDMTVMLTESGKAYAACILKPLYEKEAAVFQMLTATDKQVIEILEKISVLLRKTEHKSESEDLS